MRRPADSLRGWTCDASFQLWRFARWDSRRTANPQAPRSPIRGVPSTAAEMAARATAAFGPTNNAWPRSWQQRLLRNQRDVPRPPTRDDPAASRAAPAIQLLVWLGGLGSKKSPPQPQGGKGGRVSSASLGRLALGIMALSGAERKLCARAVWGCATAGAAC
jgi:hypothetical protein